MWRTRRFFFPSSFPSLLLTDWTFLFVLSLYSWFLLHGGANLSFLPPVPLPFCLAVFLCLLHLSFSLPSRTSPVLLRFSVRSLSFQHESEKKTSLLFLIFLPSSFLLADFFCLPQTSSALALPLLSSFILHHHRLFFFSFVFFPFLSCFSSFFPLPSRVRTASSSLSFPRILLLQLGPTRHGWSYKKSREKSFSKHHPLFVLPQVRKRGHSSGQASSSSSSSARSPARCFSSSLRRREISLPAPLSSSPQPVSQSRRGRGDSPDFFPLQGKGCFFSLGSSALF